MAEKLNVLILEDNPSDAELLLIELRRAGYEPDYQVVDNEKEFTAHLNPGLDLILSDYSLPQFTGLGALQLRNESGYDIPCIIVSGTIGEDVAVKSIQLGADDYLMKDRMRRLGSAVANAIKKRELRDEKRQSIEALRESEERNRSITQTAADAIISINSDGVILSWNRAAEKMFGFSSSEMVNKDLLKIMPAQFSVGHSAGVKRLKSGGAEKLIGKTVELSGLHKNGTEFPIELSLSSWVVGDHRYFTGIIRDITEREQAELALRGSEERFRAFMDHVPAFAYILDKDLRHIYGNPASVAADGYSTLESYIGTSIQNDYPDEISDEIEANSKKVLDEGCITNHEFSVVMQDGKTHTLLDVKFPIQLPGGNTQVGGLSIDITEMKVAQKAVYEEQEKAQKYLDIAEVMIVALNKEGEITLVNQKGASILGYQTEDLTGKNWIDVCLPAADRAQGKKTFKDFMAGGVGLGEKFEQTIITRSGEERIINWRSTPLWEWDGDVKISTGSLSSGEDITERKQAEERIERYSRIFEDSLNEIYLFDANTLAFIQVNDAAQHNLGYSMEELQKMTPLDIKPEFRSESLAKLAAPLRSGEEKEVVFETVHERKDQSLYNVEEHMQLMRFENKTIFAAIILDITDRKKAEDALRNERDNLNRVFKAMADGVYIVNKEYDIQYVNPVLKKEFGPYEGRKCYAYFHDREEVCPWCKNPEVFNGETVHWEWYSAKNQRTYDLIDTPLRNPDGSIFKLEIFRDITERVLAQEAIRQEQEKAQKYLDIAGVLMLVLNKKGEIALINQKGCQILGYQEKQLIGLNWVNTCLPERYRKEVKGVFKKIMAGRDEPVEFYENTVLTKSGKERIIAWHNTILRDEKEHITGILSSGEDITRRKRTEQLLSALNRATVAMGTSQTQQEIFSAVSEELKQLDISCMLFPLDETQSKLYTKYISYESALLNTAEKLAGNKHGDFSFPIDAVDMYREVVRDKKALFSENSELCFQQIVPKLPKKILTQIMKALRVKKSISAPLIVEDQVIGVFSIQAETLTQEDVLATTAFADQLSSAWNKIKLLKNLRKTVEGTIHTIAATVEARDPYTAGHQKRVSDLAAAIAVEMKLPDKQVEGIRMAGIIHDLGKINIPAEILSKPGKISELEYKIIQTHSQVGFDLLKEIEFPWPIAKMVHQHHEKMDGSGYPQRLKGEEIMLEARILTVADIVEAMSSHRPYRPALGIEKALKQIKKDKGTLLDSKVVNACLKIFKEGYKLLED